MKRTKRNKMLRLLGEITVGTLLRTQWELCILVPHHPNATISRGGNKNIAIYV